MKASAPAVRVALVTHDLSGGGGTGAMCSFLHRVLSAPGRFVVDIVSLATSARDTASTRAFAPRTWLAGPHVEQRCWQGLAYRHVGSCLAEFEPRRYRPRRVLDELLEPYDLLQFVVGYPAWAAAASRVTRPRLIWTATSAQTDRESRVRAARLPRRIWMRAMTRMARSVETRALRLADFVFALSPYTLEGLKGRVDPTRTGLAYCGVDTDVYRPDSAPCGNYLLSVGRFADARKNPALLLKAYASLLERRPDAPELWLAGEPPPVEGQQLLGELGLSGRVRLLGVRPGDELATLYRGARAFVLSSDEEGLAIVVLEAMASGLPVVSTSCGGPDALVAEGVTGHLTPVGDAQALAAALERLLANPELAAEMGRRARRRVEQGFSIEATARVFLDKYAEILRSR